MLNEEFQRNKLNIRLATSEIFLIKKSKYYVSDKPKNATISSCNFFSDILL